MKKTHLRRRSKNKLSVLKLKADILLQDYYRRAYAEVCESCGAPFQIIHHHIEKGCSNAGRYNENNFIFLCKKCHSKVHFGDNNVVAAYTLKRGEAWLEQMRELKTQYHKFTVEELEKIVERYQKKWYN